MSDFQCIVIARLSDLTSSTTLSPELCISLRSHELITKSEYEELSNFVSGGLHTKGASYLFTSIAPKITSTDEDKFIECLREGKNDKVVAILRPPSPGESGEAGGRVCLRRLGRAEVEFLREFVEGKFAGKGKFEGLRWEDEERANGLLRGSVRGDGSEWRLLKTEGEEFIETVRSVVKCVEGGTLWWNPNAVPLPPNFIPRRVQRLTNSGDEGECVWLSELTSVSEVFLWLVDSPGMGKSTVTTKLEEEWRRSTPSPRVIVRINLNLVHHQLQQQQEDEDDFSLVSFLKRFVPFLPVDSLSRLPGGSVKVVVLLDALDEVLPQHEATMLRLLHKLLLSLKEARELDFMGFVLRRPDIQEPLRLQKVFLTTRPHLQQLVESEFGVTAHSLLPLDQREQVEFLSKEVSGVFTLTKEDAERKLSSLSASARSLMENPLMLFLFAQVVKHGGGGGDSTDWDLFSLYESFLVAKHEIHVVEKEAADPTDPNTQRRMKNLFEENLPFYCATALAQLESKAEETWGKFVALPNEKKRAELLSFGLLTQNSAPQLRFVHRSFAEFLYARLLTAPSTPAPLSHTLFTHIYSNYPPLENVEEFVLCTFRKTKRDGLHALRPHWLPDSTWWQRLGGQEMEETLKRLLEGRLFPALGEELLSSLDLSHPKVIEALRSAAAGDNDNNIRPREWLTRRDPQWIRQRLFALPPPTTTPTTTLTPKWTDHQPQLVALLLFDHPHFLSRCLSDEEIRSGLSSCDHLVRIVCRHSKSRECREIVEGRIGKATLRKLMMSESSLWATLDFNEAAWWMAETLTRNQLSSTFSTFCNSGWLSYNFRGFGFALGGVCVYRLVAAAVGIECAGHAHGDLSEVSVEGVRRVFGGGEEGVAALRFLLPRVGDVGLLEELEKLDERGGRWDAGGGADILARLFAVGGHFVWDASEHKCPISVLPFVIRCGTPQDFKELVSTDGRRFIWPRSSAGAVCAPFVLSVLVDHTPHTHNTLKRTNFTRGFVFSASKHLWNFLSRVGVDDLRAASLSAGHSPLKGQWPLVRQVNWGQVVLTLLKTRPFTLEKHSLESAVENFLRHVPCCDTHDLLLQFLHQNSSLRGLLLRRVKSEVAGGRRPGHFESPSLRCRLRGLIQFALEVNSAAFTEAATKSARSFVVSVLVESRLPSPHGHSPGGWAHLTTLLPSLRQQLQTDFPSKDKSPRDLVRIFPSFQTEWEWSEVLHTLRIIQNDLEEIPPESQLRFYCRPHTPLLRVWLRHFGVDEARKVAEDFDWREYCEPPGLVVLLGVDYPGSPGEAVLLAVELGSLKMLEEVAWPSVLWWRDAEGRSLLQVAVATWGEGHEVSSFLRGKFNCALNSE